jgi:hypothetical protein
LFAALALLNGCGGMSPEAPAELVASLPIPSDLKVCQPGEDTVVITGTVAGEVAKSYFQNPFYVHPDSKRVEVSYQWSDVNPKASTGTDPNDTTVMDLAVWDQRGYKDAAGFRGWSGDRQGRIDRSQAPVFIEKGTAERGYTAGPIEAGTWYAEIGVAIASNNGAEYEIRLDCFDTDSVDLVVADPVDPNFVANANSGWYHGDFHMHGYNSNPSGADAFEMATVARDVGLDVLFYTDYVVVAHWDQIGSAQRANPDLLFYPGREIITYSGHANTLGETRGFVEYRHGFEGENMGDMQARAIAAGALFQVNHPKQFAIDGLENLCRGCQWNYEAETDWSQVHTMELLTGPAIVSSDQVGAPSSPGSIENPFMQMAIDYWTEKLQQGFKITAVSGSDSKGTESGADINYKGYGTSATAILADSLSQADVRAAILRGRTFVKTLGTDESPHIELEAFTSEQSVTYGGEMVLPANDTATLRLTVTDAQFENIVLYRNGIAQGIPTIISSDPFVHEVQIGRDVASEGPLGTWWYFQITSNSTSLQGQTVPLGVIRAIGNPVFLTAAVE